MSAVKKPLPAVDYLKLPENGSPYLEGHKCKSCKAVFLGARVVCSKCGARDQMETLVILSGGGRIVSAQVEPVEFAAGDCLVIPATFEGAMKFAEDTVYLITTLAS